jgi:hypothetical protein
MVCPVVDQRGKPAVACFLALCSDDPEDRRFAVGGYDILADPERLRELDLAILDD